MDVSERTETAVAIATIVAAAMLFGIAYEMRSRQCAKVHGVVREDASGWTDCVEQEEAR